MFRFEIGCPLSESVSLFAAPSVENNDFGCFWGW